MTLRIELERDSVENGDPVRGRVQWMSTGKEPRKIVLVCRWRITGKANSHEENLSEKIEHVDGRSQATIPFDVTIPTHGPLTYDGQLFGVVWEIVATADLPMAFDEEEKKVFTVKPRVFVKEEFAEEEDEDDDEASP